MLDSGLVSFVERSLPDPPARVLEVGAGRGELAAHLTRAGYEVLAIDPAGQSPAVRNVALAEVDEPDESFDAALAVVSLHHVEPLRESLARLAALLRPGAVFVVDEFDVGAFDLVAARWWLAQGPDLGVWHPDPDTTVHELRDHLHAFDELVVALAERFDVGAPERLPYLYRWGLDPHVRPLEEQAIARGEIPATGARVVASRR